MRRRGCCASLPFKEIAMALLFNQRVRWSWGWRCAVVLAVAMLSQPAVAADSVLETSALKYAPEDAAFYWSRMRMREQVEAVVNSKAVAKLLEWPLLKEAREQWATLQEAAGAPDVGELKEFFDLPENKQLQELLLDAISHEVFVIGDAGYPKVMEQMNALSREMNALQIEGGEAPDSEKIGELFLEHLDQLRIPSTLIGFKLRDAKAAEPQLARLEALLAEQIEMQPPEWQGRLKRETIGETEFLTLRLDGSLIPWDQLKPAEGEGPDPKQMEEVKEAISKLQLVVSVGVRDGYLLVAIGPSSASLKTLGEGKLLRDRPELAPLRKHAAKPFTSVSYVSQKMMQSSNSLDRQIDSYVAMAEQGLPLSGLDPNLQVEMLADARRWLPT